MGTELSLRTIGLDRPIEVATWSQMVSRWRGRPDIAVATPTVSWSGDELIARAAGAAHLLRAAAGSDSAGVEAIPALLESSPDALALLVAGSTTGRPLAPVSPRSTPAVLRHQLTV